MLDMSVVQSELIAAGPYYNALTPGPKNLFAGQAKVWYKSIYSLKYVYDVYKMKRRGEKASTIVGSIAFTMMKKRILRPVKRTVGNWHVNAMYSQHDWRRKNGIGGRGWYRSPRQEKLVIVYHDANRAGPHIDVHIGRVSLVYRVKPDLYQRITYKNNGELTEDSKRLLLDHVRQEIMGHSRVAQNIDHSRSNAVASWTNGDRAATHYGAGYTRQVILNSEVDIYKAHHNGPMEMYAPDLESYRPLYLYRLHNGNDSRAPICIFGIKKATHPVFDDRLHLKLIRPGEEEKLYAKADMSTATFKYDGSSCYVVITSKGTTVWSPRTSVVTGDRIEYTPMVDGIANTTSDQTIVAMGELLFKEKSWIPGRTKYLPAATGSGLLNSNSILPRNVEPEIRLYRIDKIGRAHTGDLNFWENRSLQHDVSRLNPDKLKVVELITPEQAQQLNAEGIVIVPFEASVNDGFKLKWTMDPHDWRIDRVDFRHGQKGGIAGVIYCTSLESGKSFKLGPGQVGDRALTEQMMEQPKLYEGTVIKVESRIGHEGRAAKVVQIHSDKGMAPY